MKLKYYLRGLGVGVICTAIIMGIALSGQKKETLTDAEIIERARLLGMVMEDGEPAPGEEASDPDEAEKDKPDGQKTESVAPDGQEDKPEGSSPEETGEDKGNDGEAGNEASGQQPGSNPSDSGGVVNQPSGSDQKVVELEIKEGEFSDVVSKKLFQAGLVPDAEKFNAYMTEKGVDDALRVGVHLIPAGSTADEIIEILKGKPQ